MTTAAFAPFPDLARALLPHAFGNANDNATADGSHDTSHLQRVWKNAAAIHAEEGGDAQVLFAATLLHDCVAVEKNSPLRAQASRLSADKAAGVLRSLGWPHAQVEAAAHAIAAHSFSAGIAPATLEAQTLQDADRLDAIGMLGVARCFYVAGAVGPRTVRPGRSARGATSARRHTLHARPFPHQAAETVVRFPDGDRRAHGGDPARTPAAFHRRICRRNLSARHAAHFARASRGLARAGHPKTR
jgi:uncharacterized protein